jgi:hypothetical protein
MAIDVRKQQKQKDGTPYALHPIRLSLSLESELPTPDLRCRTGDFPGHSHILKNVRMSGRGVLFIVVAIGVVFTEVFNGSFFPVAARFPGSQGAGWNGRISG